MSHVYNSNEELHKQLDNALKERYPEMHKVVRKSDIDGTISLILLMAASMYLEDFQDGMRQINSFYRSAKGNYSEVARCNDRDRLIVGDTQCAIRKFFELLGEKTPNTKASKMNWMDRFERAMKGLRKKIDMNIEEYGFAVDGKGLTKFYEELMFIIANWTLADSEENWNWNLRYLMQLKKTNELAEKLAEKDKIISALVDTAEELDAQLKEASIAKVDQLLENGGKIVIR